jgi:hypothetical protein
MADESPYVESLKATTSLAALTMGSALIGGAYGCQRVIVLWHKVNVLMSETRQDGIPAIDLGWSYATTSILGPLVLLLCCQAANALLRERKRVFALHVAAGGPSCLPPWTFSAEGTKPVSRTLVGLFYLPFIAAFLHVILFAHATYVEFNHVIYGSIGHTQDAFVDWPIAVGYLCATVTATLASIVTWRFARARPTLALSAPVKSQTS